MLEQSLITLSMGRLAIERRKDSGGLVAGADRDSVDCDPGPTCFDSLSPPDIGGGSVPSIAKPERNLRKVFSLTYSSDRIFQATFGVPVFAYQTRERGSSLLYVPIHA